MNSGTTGVKIDTKIKKRLKSLARLKDRSTHWMMKAAILEYLEREESREKEKQEDQERWENYQETGRFIAHEDVALWLDSIGTNQERPCPR